MFSPKTIKSMAISESIPSYHLLSFAQIQLSANDSAAWVQTAGCENKQCEEEKVSSLHKLLIPNTTTDPTPPTVGPSTTQDQTQHKNKHNSRPNTSWDPTPPETQHNTIPITTPDPTSPETKQHKSKHNPRSNTNQDPTQHKTKHNPRPNTT
ncbi:uncharacterized [Tachysurus ichikawai]